MSVSKIAAMVSMGTVTKQYAGLFQPCSNFDFGTTLPTYSTPPQQHDYNTTAEFMRANDAWTAQQNAPRAKVAKEALSHFYSTAESTKEWYDSKGVKLHSSPDSIQFVEYTDKGFVVHDEPRHKLLWLQSYLARVALAPVPSSVSSSSLALPSFVSTVVFRPIIMSSSVRAYYVCPVVLNRSQDAWATCGYQVSAPGFFRPLDLSSPAEFIDELRDPESGDFSLPASLAPMPWQKIAWFWAECGYAFGEPDAASSALPAPRTPAAPQPAGVFNFEGYGGGVNILTGAAAQGAGSIHLTAGAAPRTNQRDFFDEQPAIEPSDKLIAAIGTAAAAAITIGVATAVS